MPESDKTILAVYKSFDDENSGGREHGVQATGSRQQKVQAVGSGRSGLGKQWRAQTGGRGQRTNWQPQKEQYCGELNSGVWIETKFVAGGNQLVGLEKGEPWLLLVVVLSHFYPLLVI